MLRYSTISILAFTIAVGACATTEQHAEAPVDYKNTEMVYNTAPESVFVPGQAAPVQRTATTQAPQTQQIQTAPQPVITETVPPVSNPERKPIIITPRPSEPVQRPAPQPLPPAPKETAALDAPQIAGQYGPLSGAAGLYKVAPKDTVYGIARRHCLAPADIIESNSTLKSPYVLHPGDSLQLPAWSCELSDAEVAALNINPQDPVVVAEQPATDSDYNLSGWFADVEPRGFVIKGGDTLYSISKRYCTDVATLAAMNDMIPPYTLTIGQTVTVPFGNCGL